MQKNPFDRAMDRLLGIEGGYANIAADSGGATRFGITQAVARAHGYGGDMRELTLQRARDIYRAQYWNLLQLDYIAHESAPVAWELFECGVNTGVGRAATFLQRALNGLNREARDYADVSADGVIGPVTLYAFRRYMVTRANMGGEGVLLKALNCLQGAHYIELAESRAKDETFLFGWLRERVELPSMSLNSSR